MPEHITVVIPTFNRPDSLRSCLRGLDAQTRMADRVVVVVRPTDRATHQVLAGWPEVSVADVLVPGFIPALNAGAAAVHSDIVAFTDDDAVARPTWLEAVERHFDLDPGLTGVGGRDVIGGVDVAPGDRSSRVGFSRFGRIIGNHHLGSGPPRIVTMLKGVNVAYRREHLGARPFDTRLRGLGGHNNELALGTRLVRDGRRLLYDPDIVVDHYPATRVDGWRRLSIEAGHDQAFNEQLAFAGESQIQRALALAWGLAVGTKSAPGLINLLRSLSIYDRPLDRLTSNGSARIRGWMAARRSYDPG